jgi:FkbM family methyltransferase
MSTNNSAEASLTRVLEELLTHPMAEVSQYEKSRFDEQAGTLGNSIVLFGAGGLGRKTLRGLRNLGIEPLAFADNNVSLHGHQVDGLIVLSPEQAGQQFGKKAIFIVAIFMDSAPGGIEPLTQKLNSLGCTNVISFVHLYWKYPDQFLPHYAYDLPHKVIAAADSIRKAWAFFNDQVSQKEFLAQIQWRLDPEFDQIPAPARHEIYFPPDLFKLNRNEVFIDCGAYNGDTVKNFLRQTDEQFTKILAFEPDPANYKTLTELVASLPSEVGRRILTSDLALGRRSEQLYFNAQSAASSSRSESGEIVVRSEPLDLLLKDEAPTFIKMDIEGAEMDALNGAANTIRAHHPILAISAYHCQDHIWEIPLLVNALSDSYKFFLRRYHPRVLDDLVLYAIPASSKAK